MFAQAVEVSSGMDWPLLTLWSGVTGSFVFALLTGKLVTKATVEEARRDNEDIQRKIDSAQYTLKSALGVIEAGTWPTPSVPSPWVPFDEDLSAIQVIEPVMVDGELRWQKSPDSIALRPDPTRKVVW